MAERLQVTVKLFVPVMHGDEEVTELHLTEPTFKLAKELDRFPGEGEKSIRLVAACTGLPPSVIEQLCWRDMKAVNDAVEQFMGESYPETGANSGLPSPSRSTGRRVN